MLWTVLVLVAAGALVVGFNKRGGAWGSATMGLLLGLVIAGILALIGKGFHWSIVWKSVVVLTIGGLAFDGALWLLRQREN